MSPLSKPNAAAWLRVCALALIFTGALLARPAAAQTEQTFGDWRLSCDALPDGGQQCALVQEVAASDRDDAWLRAFAFLPTDGGDQMLLSVLVPLQVILIKGLGLKIDDGELVTFDYIRCSMDGCLATIALDDTRMAALRDGAEALVIYYFEDAQGIGLPLSLNGFGAGTDALRL